MSIVEVFADEDGIGVVDETGFIKKGTRSVGVKRQYSGTAGKIENCQVGTFLSYATPKGHVFLDRRLYLPEEWCNDAERRTQAKVPEDVSFQTKPEQAMAMLEQAWQAGVPMRWVAGDEVYGDATELRDLVARHGRWYVLAVRTPTPVWTQRPAVAEPEPQERGRPRTKVRLADGAAPATTVKEVVASWPERRWQRLVVAEGEKGLIAYDWACQRVVESRNGLPGPRRLADRPALHQRSDRARLLPVECARRHAAAETRAGGRHALHGGAVYRGGQGRDRSG